MRSARIVGAVVALVTAVAYSVLTLRRFHSFQLSSFDNAIFEQAIGGYARNGVPTVDVKGPGFNILGDHFSPVTALIAPVYRVLPSAETVLLAQVFLLAVSAAVMTAVAVRLLDIWWGTLVGVMYAFSFGLQSAVKADFHEVAFAAPLLALAGAAFVEQRYSAVIGWTVPLVFVKEDLGLTVAAVGFALWLVGERRRGLWLAGGGVLATVVTVAVIIPAFAANGAYAYGGTLGGESGVVQTLFAGLDTKFTTLALTAAITGFAACLSPWLVVVVPTFAWRFAGDVEFYWGTEWHYSLVIMPIVFTAMLDAIRRDDQRRWLIPLGALVTVGTWMGSPLADLAKPTAWEETPRIAAGREIVAAVPEGASVVTDIGLLSHLVTDRTTYWLGTIDTGPESASPEYAAFDVASRIGSPDDPLAWAETKYGGDWETVIEREGLVLVRLVD